MFDDLGGAAGSGDSELIYHYCSCDTFMNILRGKKLWLSSMKRSNDAKEGGLIHAELNRVLKEDDRIANNVILRNLARDDNMLRRSDALAFCLSKKRDLLSQWRGYADDGRGFVIGFNSDQLKAILNSAFPRYTRVEPVTYLSRMEVTKRANEVIRDVEALCLDESFQSIERHLYKECFQTKSSGFFEEEEVRAFIIYHEDDGHVWLDLKFRNSGGRLVPYVEIDFKNDAEALIKEIILGPKNLNRCEDLKLFLLKNGYSQLVNNSMVKYSEITYR